MISRKSAMAIAEAYTAKFLDKGPASFGSRISCDRVYDFLYECSYDSWICNILSGMHSPREFKLWLLALQTGEVFARVVPNHSLETCQAMGQRILQKLAEDFLRISDQQKINLWEMDGLDSRRLEISRRLELDGYVFSEGKLYLSEVDVLDVEVELSLLQALYRGQGLQDETLVFEFLNLAETHYLAGRWSDSIGNVRKYFELCLFHVALRYSTIKNIPLASDAKQHPVKVREYFKAVGLIEEEEREAIAKIYGLLSHTGGHPYMAEQDQARLLRQLAVTICQFMLLRLQGALK